MMSVFLKRNVSIIVMNVVVDNANNILMMKETKRECFGKWYLPAGRLERYETLQEGSQRECKEETGLSLNIQKLLCVELSTGNWIRVTFVGQVSGGELKKIADKESLEGGWLPIEAVIKGGSKTFILRSKDIVKVIKYWSQKSEGLKDILPSIIPHSDLKIQLFVIMSSKTIDNTKTMFKDQTTNTAPLFNLCDDFMLSIHRLLSRFYIETFVSLKYIPRNSLPLLGLQYGGTTKGCDNATDGILLQVLIEIDATDVLFSNQWTELTETDKSFGVLHSDPFPELLFYN